MDGTRTSTAARPSPFPQNQASQDALGISRRYSTSPNATRRSFDTFNASHVDGDAFRQEPDSSMSTLLLRKLSVSMNQEALNSMLIFASNLLDASFLDQPMYEDDRGHQTAIARFSTVEGAFEVLDRLHGKPNAAGDSSIIVEIIKGPQLSSTGGELQSSTSDAQALRLSSSHSSGGSNHARSSRFSNQFHNMEQRTSPTRVSRFPGSIDLTGTDGVGGTGLHGLFSPTSPIRSSTERNRVSSRSVIGEDTTDDETRELLQDPRAFAESNHKGRSNSHHLASQMGGLRLDIDHDSGFPATNGHPLLSPSVSSPYNNSGRSFPPTMQTPNTDYASSYGFSPTSPHESFSPQHSRHQLPPANPADQNPPCNTLYVGNLPIDTSEDELKAVFSKQRGYKRLCFRTKHNGPMCFVEFEDVSFATKALKELYGHMLHNSVKGGIRLSFSKNPLGVRKDQMNLHSPMSPMGSGFGGFGGPGFSTANGPPPGLAYPPGLSSSMNSPLTNRHDRFSVTPTSPPQNSFLGSHADIFQGQLAYMSGSRGYPSMGSAFADPASRR